MSVRDNIEISALILSLDKDMSEKNRQRYDKFLNSFRDKESNFLLTEQKQIFYRDLLEFSEDPTVYDDENDD